MTSNTAKLAGSCRFERLGSVDSKSRGGGHVGECIMVDRATSEQVLRNKCLLDLLLLKLVQELERGSEGRIIFRQRTDKAHAYQLLVHLVKCETIRVQILDLLQDNVDSDHEGSEGFVRLLVDAAESVVGVEPCSQTFLEVDGLELLPHAVRIVANPSKVHLLLLRDQEIELTSRLFHAIIPLPNILHLFQCWGLRIRGYRPLDTPRD